jgi:GT2 family glycosyltransferase
MKDLNIAFVNYMMKDDIEKSLESLRKDLEGCEYDVEISVADNSQNEDEIKDMLKEKFPEVNYVDSGGNIGFGKANNMIFEKHPARYYMSLNPDTEILEDSNTIQNIINFMDDNPDIGAIGPKLIDMDENLQYSCYRYNLSSILIKPLRNAGLGEKFDWIKEKIDKMLMKDFDHDENRPVDWVQGSALVVRKEAADEVGFYDDRYFMYMEDADWCHELWKADWPVYYAPDIVIKHRHARDSASDSSIIEALFKNKLARIHLSSWLKYLWKWRFNHK